MRKDLSSALVAILCFSSTHIIIITVLELPILTKIILLILCLTGTVAAMLGTRFSANRGRANSQQMRHLRSELDLNSSTCKTQEKQIRKLELAKEESIRKQTILFDLTIDTDQLARTPNVKLSRNE